MFLSFLFALLPQAPQAPPDAPHVFPGSTCKLEQLTGERDVARGVFTRSRTESAAGLVGTDLGSSFEHDGKLYFLFGDSAGGAPNADVIAWSSARTPGELALEFHTDEDGRFRRLTLPGVSSDAFEVPSYGISLDGAMYVVFTTDHSKRNTMGRSVLGRSRDDGHSFERVFDLSTKHFVNVALQRASAGDHAGLPEDDCVLVWGSGKYRASNVRLALAPTDRFADRSAWRYFAERRTGSRRGPPTRIAPSTSSTIRSSASSPSPGSSRSSAG